MLVRFLSFCATVLGTARYKAIFLSCLTIVIAFSGVTAVALMKGNSEPDSPAASVKQEEAHSQEDGFAPQLGGVRKQDPKQPVEQSGSTKTSSASENTAAKPAETTPVQPEASNTEIVASAADIRLTGEESKSVTFNTSDNTKVTWSVTVNDPDGGLQVTAPNGTEDKSFTFQVKADKDTTHKSYTITVTAEDAARNLTPATKTITVTVQ